MDYQGRMLAQAEYDLSNQLARRARRSQLLDARERGWRLPRIPSLPLGFVRGLKRAAFGRRFEETLRQLA